MTTAALPRNLEDQAASAALLADRHQKARAKKTNSILDEDGRLSSASAATSLKYAKAQDLPSFPSAGLKMSSAGAAASLADSNKKQFEHWKPGEIPAANKAALLAKDYEMDALWQPEMSTAGSKAALLAHNDPPSVEPIYVPASKQGQSAAGQALRGKGSVKAPEREVPTDSRRKAMMAAAGAMSGNRPRAGSYPTAQSNESKSWALKAATKSHKASPASQPFASGDPGFEAARIQNLAKNNVNRELFGSTPPVDIEIEERNRQDTLRASAVAMAQKMYAIQQAHIDQASGVSQSGGRAAAVSSHRRNTSDISASGTEVAIGPRYENLEEAARKLAQERLAKLHDEHAEYRSYYGATSPPPKSRLSMRLRSRRASTGDESDSDTEQSRRIRKQMSIFTSKIAEVDKTKRQADRDKLLEAAHRNVEARMNKLDEKVFQDTGKASPAQRELWERQARERAQKQVDLALQNVGKVHIGGGQYLDKEEVDAIARARLQPTLDEISDKAEKMRARDEEIRLEQERVATENAAQKARDAEIKAELKASQQREKQETKAKRDEEKRQQKELHDAEKEKARIEKENRNAELEAQKEKARLEKEEKRKSKDFKAGRFSSILGKKPAPTTTDGESAVPKTEPLAEEATPVEATEATVHDQVTHARSASEQSNSVEGVTRYEDTTRNAEITATSPNKRDSRVKSWFKTHIRGPSKAQKDEGSALTNDGSQVKEDSLHKVTMAGRGEATSASAMPSQTAEPARSPSISSLSSDEPGTAPFGQTGTTNNASDSENKSQGTGLKQKLFSKIRGNKTEDGGEEIKKTSATDDEIEEARDTVPIPVASTIASDRARTSIEGSKFKEEL